MCVCVCHECVWHVERRNTCLYGRRRRSLLPRLGAPRTALPQQLHRLLVRAEEDVTAERDPADARADALEEAGDALLRRNHLERAPACRARACAASENCAEWRAELRG